MTPGHQLLFTQAARRAKKLCQTVGSLVYVESYFSFRPTRGSGDGGPGLRADEQLIDVLPHPVYLLLDALGRETQAQPDVADLSRGPGGTVHALLRIDDKIGHLVVTLEGRPVESYLRVAGTRGSVEADFVRNTVQHSPGARHFGYREGSGPLQDCDSAPSRHHAVPRWPARRHDGRISWSPGSGRSFSSICCRR